MSHLTLVIMTKACAARPLETFIVSRTEIIDGEMQYISLDARNINRPVTIPARHIASVYTLGNFDARSR